jgi:ABC-type transporter Mla subunit MlaD
MSRQKLTTILEFQKMETRLADLAELANSSAAAAENTIREKTRELEKHAGEKVNQISAQIESRLAGLQSELESAISEVRQFSQALDEAEKMFREKTNRLTELIDEKTEALKELVYAKTEALSELVDERAGLFLKTEARLADLAKRADERIELFRALAAAQDKIAAKRDPLPAIAAGTKENVWKLKREGWKSEQIAKALRLAVPEVELILEIPH